MLSPLVFLLLLRPALLCSADSFRAKIHGVNIALDKVGQSNRLQDLAAVASAPSSVALSTPIPSASGPSSNSVLPSVSGSLPVLPSAAIGDAGLTSAAVGDAGLTSAAAVSFQIYTADLLPTAPAPPAACAAALTASVACNETITMLGSNPWFDASTLTALCTATCTAALSSYRAAVVSACGTYRFPGPNDISYAPTLAVDTISGPYAVQCRQDTTTKEFCNQVLTSFGPTPAQGLLGYPTNELCTPCMLGTLNATLSNPLTFYPDFYADLQAALKVCGSAFVSYNVTHPPTTTSIFVPGPSSTPIGANGTTSAMCAITGRTVTTTGSSTCASIASQFSVGWYDVLTNNPTIEATNCTAGIGAGTKLCLPQACTTYTPTANQTCEDIVAAANTLLTSTKQTITVTQLVSFNPTLELGCVHVGRQIGLSLCISPHGGFPDVDAVDNGAQPPVPSPTAIVPPPGPTPPGTTSKCGGWYFVQPNDFCTKVALSNSVTLGDLQLLNPELNADCTNLWAHTWYCVAAFPPLGANAGVSAIPTGTGSFSIGIIALPSATPDAFDYPTGYMDPPPNLAPGSISTGCNLYYDVVAGDNCTGVEATFEIPTENFTTWNFNPAAPCPTLTAGTAVCVLVTNATATIPPTPTNAAAGSAPSGCASWYTIATGDTCPKVEAKFNLTQAQFFSLNPELAPSCTNLALNEAYCVRALPNAVATTGPPADLNAGSWNNCTSYYTVQTNDNCNIIDTKANISFSDLLHWNPEITATCSNLNIASYCVGITGGCQSIYTVVSGDSCSAIETKTGLTDAQLRALNPWLSAACAVQLGQNICIKNSNVAMPAPPPPTSGPPANLNAGSWNNCTSYYTVQTNDNCNIIDTKANISFSDLLHWNPEITTTCSNLNIAGYCVGVAGGCQSIYTVVSGDSCGAIETKTGLTDAQLRALNPWLTAACTVQVGQNICIKNANVAMPTGPPANLNPGSWSNCTTYYTVATGDNCNVIESKFKIGFSDILRWNPEVTATCSNLNLAAYCVLGSSACTKLYTVVAGDSCGAIETKEAIADAKLHSQNTWINAGCTNIAVGQNICV
ncbi:hypothetical protein C8R46DRAFT_1229785 [Mycena filopes]|nr:hypothetical protein C8R46DRAFT_1229785 [Mycena filopes]